MADLANITRRYFLKSAPAVASAVALPGCVDVAMAEEEPVDRILRIAEELSAAMDAWPLGAEHWCIAVYPASRRKQPSFEQV